MRRVWMLTVVVLAAALLAAPALAQEKWVRGPVKAIGPDTITVTVKGADHVFKVEKTTLVLAKGGSTAMRQAEQGKPAPKLSDFIKIGDHAEVHYKEAAGAKVATQIRPVATEGEAVSEEQEPPATGAGASASGAIVSVAADAIVIKVDNKDMKFGVTPKTKITGPGMSTKTRELKAANKPAVITEFLKPNDYVTIYYSGEPPVATGVRMINKALK
jgi:hypothetical protein